MILAKGIENIRLPFHMFATVHLNYLSFTLITPPISILDATIGYLGK
jgi:hypothetical protein